MLINQAIIPDDKYLDIIDTIDYSHYEFNQNYIRAINNCSVKIKAKRFIDLIELKVHIEAEVIGVCSYTLEDVNLPLKFDDTLTITSSDDGINIYEENNIFSFDEYALALILDKLPKKIIKKGAKPPSGGEGYRIISEEDLQKEKEKNNPFSKLDELDLD